MTSEETKSHNHREHCANCSTPLHGHYCSSCGQKQRHPHDLTLAHFIGHAIHDFTHFDSKFLGSIKSVLFSPGKLTTEFTEGREARYMKPLQLFIVINVIYFLFVHFFPITTFETPLQTQFTSQPYRATVQKLVLPRIENLHTKWDIYERAYDQVTRTQAKSLVFLMVPIFAALLAVLFFTKRRFFVEHIVFTLHFYAFFLIVCSFGVLIEELFVEIISAIFGVTFTPPEMDDIFSFGPAIVSFIYLFIALRRVYGEGKIVTAIKASFLTYSLLYILFAYRFILFFTTYYSVDLR